MNVPFSSACRHFSSISTLVFLLLASISQGQTQPPSFSLGLSPASVGIGSCSELTFEIQNNSQLPANNLAFSLNLPVGVALTEPVIASSDCGGTLTAIDGGNSIALSGGSVGGNSTCFITVGVTLLAEGPFNLTTGNLTSSSGNSGSATTQIGIPTEGPSLGFSKSFSTSPIQLGGQTTLTYVIQNQSQVDAINITFSDDLSPGIVVANQPNITNSCENSVLTALSGSQQITFSGGTLSAGQSCQLSLDVVGVTAGANLSVSESITSSFQNSPPTPSGRACAVLEVIPPEDLANITFSKRFLEDSVGPGATTKLEFTITNNSATDTFSNIAFTDDLEAMLPGAVAVNLPYEGGFFIDASFEGNAPVILSRTWQYLDELQNENGRSDDYPLDGSGNTWTDPLYEPSTSTIGPWQSGDAPFQAGEIDAFPPGTPSVLDGVDDAPNGQNLVTTYLFRQTFVLDAAQAQIENWFFDHVADDGAIVYLNGSEVFRSPQMPAGAVTTTTLSGLGDESGITSSPVNLAGFLVTGENTIAVEVHQNSLESSDAGFLLNLVPAAQSPTGGFRYVDDIFGNTNDAGFSDGAHEPAGGASGGGISVTTGGKGFFSFLNPPSSGGWTYSFTVTEAGVYPVNLQYRLLFDASYENDESGQALLEIDGVRYGNGPGNSLAQFTGGVGFNQDTGWQNFSANLFFSAGQHTISVGAYNSKSSEATELTRAFFDNIQIGTPRVAIPVCGPESVLDGSSLLSFTGGSLAPGQTCSFEVDISIPLNAPFGDYPNTTSLISTDVIETSLVGFPATDILTVAPVVPVFSMDFNPGTTNAGDSATLTYTIDNSGSQLPAENITLNNQFSAGLILASPINATNTCQGGNLAVIPGADVVSYSGGTVPPGEICVITVNVTSLEGGDFENASDELTSSLGNSGTASDTINIQPVVSIVIEVESSIESVIAGSGSENLTYTITATNNGPSTATNIIIDQMETLPDGAMMANANASLGAFNNMAWSIPSLSSGQSETLIITYNVDENTVQGANAISGGASLRSVDQLDLDDSDNSATDLTSVANVFDIAIEKVESIEPVLAGTGPGNLSYTISATNTGPSNATNVRIREALNLPVGVSIDSIVPSSGTFTPPNSSNGLWALDLALGETATLEVILTVGASAPDEGSISSTATLESALGTDTNEANNSASETTAIVAGVDLVVTQSGPESPVVAGSEAGNLTFTVEISNLGPLAATGVKLSEVLDLNNGITFDSTSPSAGSFDGQTWTVGDLAVGASETLEVTLTVTSSAASASPGVTSAASVSAVDQPEINPGNESATTTADIDREVDLFLNSTNSRDPVLAGFDLPQNLFHTITLTNNGPSDASGIEVNLGESLPPGASVDSISPEAGTSYDDSIWSVGDLAAGSSTTIIYYFNVPGTVIGGVDLVENDASVSTANELLLNPDDDTTSIATDVVSPSSAGITSGGIALDFQTGLFKQVITVTNDNPGSIPSFRVLVNGLPDGVSVHNAQGTAEGASYLLYNQPLASGESVDLTVEYFQLDASGAFEPSFELELLDPEEEPAGGEGVTVDRCEALPNGDILIEFDAQIGQIFTIQHSEDGESWNNVVPDVVAGGTRLQWIDNGPPKTPSHPSSEKLRLYRVLQKNADQ